MSWIDTPYLLVTGLLTGVVFGVLLQKGGVTRYATIIGQFLFTDYTMLKIMLSAVVVGAIGVCGMLQLGLITHLLVKPALLAANAAGGLILAWAWLPWATAPVLVSAPAVRGRVAPCGAWPAWSPARASSLPCTRRSSAPS